MKKYILDTLPEFKNAEKYWLEKLSGQLSELRLPGDFYSTRQYEEAVYKIGLTRQQYEGLVQICKNNDLSLYVVLLTALKILLFKYTGEADICVTSPIFTLINSKYNKFVILRDFVRPGMTFKELLGEVKQTVADGYKNEHYSLKNLLENLKADKGTSLCRVVLLLENIHNRDFITDIKKDYENDITIAARRDNGKLEAEVSYNSKLFKAGTIHRLIDSYLGIITGILNDRELRIRDVQLMTIEEKNKILFQFNRRESRYPLDKTLHGLFEEQVEKNPDRVAVCSTLDLSDIYEELKSENLNLSLVEKLEKCCFEKNSFILETNMETSAGKKPLKILKTQRHTCMIVNSNVLQLLNAFDGKQNLSSIFARLKDRDLEMYVYPVSIDDVVEISCTYGSHVKKFSMNRQEEFFQLIKLLYKQYFIELKSADSGISVGNQGETGGMDFDEKETFDEPAVQEDLFNQSKSLSRRDVLLLGDTPGMPSVGLLYMASYLWRNGIKAYCHFNDLNGDYQFLKRNIETLLEKIRPRFVGISMKWFLYIARVLEIGKIVKAYSPGIKVVVGGNSASYYPEKVIRYDFIDYVVRGDGEVPLLKICRGEDHIPNCIYKKDGKIITNPITYVHDESNSREVYLSNLDEILISRYAFFIGSIFIPTQKGCSFDCCYCGGCKDAQEKAFARKGIFRRGIGEVRKDIIETQKYASVFMFEMGASNEYYLDHFKKLTEGIDLTSHFCIYANYIAASAEIVEFMSRTFKYVYWDLDMASLSQGHRDRLVSMGLVKIQPTDEEIIEFYNACEKYKNGEVRMNLITGLPYFQGQDIEASDKMFSHVMKHYSCFGDFHWGRLHAQPGAPIILEAEKHGMYSLAKTYEEFLEYSEMNFNKELPFPGMEDYDYPYIYFNDEELNSMVSKYSADTRGAIAEYKLKRREEVVIDEKLSYLKLNQKANQLARNLEEKGVTTGSIVALAVGNPIAAAVSLLGILKAGGAYLPIDPGYPEERIIYLLRDSRTHVLITGKPLFDHALRQRFPVDHIINVDDETIYTGDPSNLNTHDNPDELAYVIHTSGTTGTPRGILVEHRGVVNYTGWRLESYEFTDRDVTLQPLSYCFDGYGSNFYSSLLSGGTLFIVPHTRRSDIDYITTAIRRWRVTNVSFTPGLYELLLINSREEDLRSLRFVVLAAEMSWENLVKKSKEKLPGVLLINEYGPTETSVGAAAHLGINEKKLPVIGKPFANVQVYILDAYLQPVPVNVWGELFISGMGVARGYLNNPESTSGAFVNNSFIPGTKMFGTGDMARWLPDGNIELWGRKDQQVKIRGFRVEPGEIEKRLLGIDSISEAVVIAAGRSAGSENAGKDLCAYVVSDQEISPSQLRRLLAEKLPDYMIPTYFVQLESIPLTAHGKVDRKALPPHEAKTDTGYIAPRNEIEEKLVKIWSEVLNVDEDIIGIDSNFFELGGHSLKAVNLKARLYKEFNLKIRITEIFKTLSIRSLYQLINETAEGKFAPPAPIEPVKEQEYYDISYAQGSLWAAHRIEEDQIAYIIPGSYTFEGNLNREALEKTLETVVKRHEILRTTIPMIDGEPKQKVHGFAESGFRVQHIDLRDRDNPEGTAREIADQEGITPFNLEEGPLLRVKLLQVEDQKYILLFTMHHIAADGWSMIVLLNEVLTLYNVFNKGKENPLPPLRIQYKDYSAWHHQQLKGENLKRLQDYWWSQFSGNIPVLELPLDYPRGPVKTWKGNFVELKLDEGVSKGLAAMSQQQGATLFMTLLTAVYTLLYCYTGSEDMVLGTAVSGRDHPDLGNQIGFYLNMLTLRIRFSGNDSFYSLLNRVKETTLNAMENQLYPFDMLVKDLNLKRDMSRSPLFDVTVHLMNRETGNKSENGLEGVSVGGYGFGTPNSKFDLMFNFWEGKDSISLLLKYNSDLFKHETIARMANRFEVLAGKILKDPGIVLSDLGFEHEINLPTLQPISRLSETQEVK
jgi:amino acid adenylation domain-containing protein